MQTYVNATGDVYLSTVPRALGDIPVAPKPFDESVFNFETGRWELPVSIIFRLLANIRDELLEQPVPVRLPSGMYTFFCSDIDVIKSHMDLATDAVHWKTRSKTGTGAPVFVVLSQNDLTVVHAALQAYIQQCYHHESAMTEAISSFISGGYREMDIVDLSALLRHPPDMEISEGALFPIQKAIGFLETFSLQENNGISNMPK